MGYITSAVSGSHMLSCHIIMLQLVLPLELLLLPL